MDEHQEEDNALAVNMAIDGVRHCLNICGITTPHAQNAIIAEGFIDIMSFSEIRDKDVHEMVKTINAIPNINPAIMAAPNPVVIPPVAPARGRGRGRGAGRLQIRQPPLEGQPQVQPIPPPIVVRITRRSARRLCGLIYWVKDKIRRGLVINPYELTDETLIDALQEEEGEDLADTVDAELPQKFTPERWIQWEIEFSNYLSTKKGLRGIPLAYVIRPDLKAGETIAGDDITKQEIYAAPLNGVTYKRDNNTVWSILRSCTMATPAWEWIKQLEGKSDAREGMQRLRLHYDGPDKRKARINEAENDIEKAHYKIERNFPFEKYVTKLTGAFQVLAHYGEPYPDDKKIRTLLGKINTNDPHINAGIAHVRSNAQMTFDAAVSYLADIIRLAPSSQTQTNPNHPSRRVSAAGARPGRMPGRSGRSGRSINSNPSNNRPPVHNNNDRSNFVPHEVWSILSPAQRGAIARDRNENESATMTQHGGFGRGGRGYNRRAGGPGRFDSNRGAGRGGYQGRNIHAINVDRHTDYTEMSQMTEPTPQPVQNNAGRSFGRPSYNQPSNQSTHTVSNNSTNRTNDNR
jgi:hypothetical protein